MVIVSTLAGETWDPFQMAMNMAYKWGGCFLTTYYLLTEMILQVLVINGVK